MDLNQKIIAAILAGFFLIALIRVFSAPLRLALKLLANTLLGFLALRAVGLRPAPGPTQAQKYPQTTKQQPAGIFWGYASPW